MTKYQQHALRVSNSLLRTVWARAWFPATAIPFGYIFGWFRSRFMPKLQFECGNFRSKIENGSFYQSGEQADFKMWLISSAADEDSLYQIRRKFVEQQFVRIIDDDHEWKSLSFNPNSDGLSCALIHAHTLVFGGPYQVLCAEKTNDTHGSTTTREYIKRPRRLVCSFTSSEFIIRFVRLVRVDKWALQVDILRQYWITLVSFDRVLQ